MRLYKPWRASGVGIPFRLREFFYTLTRRFVQSRCRRDSQGIDCVPRRRLIARTSGTFVGIPRPTSRSDAERPVFKEGTRHHERTCRPYTNRRIVHGPRRREPTALSRTFQALPPPPRPAGTAMRFRNPSRGAPENSACVPFGPAKGCRRW